MARGSGRPTPAFALAAVALFVALGGVVYAASGIDGHTIRPKSLPGNRLVPGSLPANRLQAGAIPGSRLAPQSVTGAQIDASTLGQVPSAARAEEAGSAREAGKAVYAQGAGDAASVNGHVAGCVDGTKAFAGACWGKSPIGPAVMAAEAVEACARAGGELPAPMELQLFGQEPSITIAASGEWTNDVASATGQDQFSVAVVLGSGKIDRQPSTEMSMYRCVFPLLS